MGLPHLYLNYRNSLFISSSKFSSKKYIIYAQTKLNENIFTSRMWWALIGEIVLHAEEMPYEKEMACLEMTVTEKLVFLGV